MSAPVDPAAAPAKVRTAALLFTIHGALRLVEAVLALVLLPQTIDFVQRTAAESLQGQDTGGVDVGGIATATAIGGTVLGVLAGIAFGILTIVFARKVLVGRNWARIVLTVFAALALPGLFAFGGPGALLTGTVSFVSTVCAVVAVVLTFLPASNPWFRRAAPSAPGL